MYANVKIGHFQERVPAGQVHAFGECAGGGELVVGAGRGLQNSEGAAEGGAEPGAEPGAEGQPEEEVVEADYEIVDDSKS